ncbi:acrylyl-CoA reductase (NADPH) [Neptuniibacter pectenicola]|jgi:acrylyl-CoA reductase (NADPH)|uniref:acrylyl-CoA reductase (NADPH) n=1 Tax=Neptuniibacter pectenicola TaxID=1806669 RepID=UPI00079A832F|nr:MDR family oxidoreductase [Neptuniibacter pectenicola]KXJ54714.1 MAG: acryloyl-CoA reductase [Neptuniibacter sp. Phe_28]
MFKALVLNQNEGKTTAAVEQLAISDLPEEDVLIKVDYSSLNYKDGLAVTGKGKIIRNFPMVPGIDLVGTVEESADARYTKGDKVVLTGWGVGENYWGGYSQYARLKADWLVPLPKGMDPIRTMQIGTAGLTAMLCVMALEEGGVTPERGPVVVSGAAGGVGSVAVAILSGLGYTVAAITGRAETEGYLRALGASEILSRDEMAQPPRPLEKQKWAGAIDTVGDTILARMIAETDYSGVVAACGLAASFKLPSTVMPFILRNVRLQGVDSVSCPYERRNTAWQRLLTQLPENALGEIAQIIALDEVPDYAEKITNGQIQGRVVIDLNA